MRYLEAFVYAALFVLLCAGVGSLVMWFPACKPTGPVTGVEAQPAPVAWTYDQLQRSL